MWGVFPLYWPLLKPSGAGEVLAHRILWSLIVIVALLAVRRRWAWMRTLGGRRLGLLTVAAFVLGINWLVFIWAVNNGQVVQTSLGYFTNPLVLVLLGVFVLHERLRPAQWAAVSLATVAVVVLTIDFGGLPWVALSLAFSFATYGLLKKTADVGPVESLSVETAALLLPALGFVVWLGATGEATFGSEGVGHALLLAASGVVTAIPLLCFGAAAVRIPLSTLGLLQYLAPVMQFALGVFWFDEPMPASRVAGFALIWLALAILSVDGLGERRRRTLRMAVEPV
jgi:chloramphenicol-sensitive protein RarD